MPALNLTSARSDSPRRPGIPAFSLRHTPCPEHLRAEEQLQINRGKSGVPESGGRIHTSTATVAVLPVVEDVEIEINPADIKMEVFRASGAGGQHINKTSSAVRLIHEPSGIVVECQTERSQFQNRDNAMKMLRTKLYEIEKQKQDSEVANARKSQVGSGDRSEKIRTYNYPQNRISDHRINLTLYRLDYIMNDGLFDEVIDPLIADHQSKLIEANGL